MENKDDSLLREFIQNKDKEISLSTEISVITAPSPRKEEDMTLQNILQIYRGQFSRRLVFNDFNNLIQSQIAFLEH